MAAVIHHLGQFYRDLVAVRDPRTKDFFLAGSLWPILGLLVVYWFFVFKWGPALMKNRGAFNLDRILQVYNAVQVMLCAHLVYEGFSKCYGPWGNYHWTCQPVDYSNTPEAISIAERVHMYFLIKVLDLLDTVFFVLRKKQSQVTFLHVYHHMGMVAFGWLGTVFLPGGNGVMIGFVNCIVHVVMYSYYFLTIWDPEQKKNIWWKKYITQLQILQFMIFVVHNSFLITNPSCGYPYWTAMFTIPQFFFFMLLFMDFYRKTYIM